MVYLINNYPSHSGIDSKYQFETSDEAFEFCETASGNFPFNPNQKSVIKWKWHSDRKQLWGWIKGFKDSATGKLIPTFIMEFIN